MKKYADYQLRVIDEKLELDSKIDKLLAFVPTDVFKGLSEEEQEEIEIQSMHMRAYSSSLWRRIHAFQTKGDTEFNAEGNG